MISKLVSGGQNGDAMRNSMPKTNHHGAKREDVAALACPIQKRDKRPIACDAEHWIETEVRLRDTRLEKLKNKSIEEHERRNLYGFPAMRAITRGL